MKKTKDSGKIRNKIQTFAAAMTILFAFGTVAHARVTASPTSVSFGNQPVGSASASQTVTITNESSRRHVTISSVSDSAAQFSFSGPTLPVVLSPGQSLTGSVTFKPSAAQAYSGVLAFQEANGFSVSVNLSGIGTSVTVTPQAPSITAQPVSQGVSAGQTATFSVAATGTSPMTFQWMKNGTAVSGATSSSYTTPPTTASDNASKFTVVANNSMGSATSSAATLTVNSTTQACVTSTEAWANYPLPQTATGSFRVTFDATASTTMIDGVTGISFGPASAYTNLAAIVRFNNLGFIDAMNSTAYTAVAKIPYSASIAYHFILDVNAVAHTYNAYVMIGSVQTTIGSNLVFRAEQATTSSFNNIGAMSTIASHSVCNVALSQSTVAAVAPSITSQPASKSLTAGQTATFNVAATGTAPMTYQWKKNGAAISGAASSSYTTPAETTTDNNAQFTVAVSNSVGSATSNAAALTVTSAAVAPAITTQPASQTIVAGKTASFAIAASGTAPMTYQWQKNGTAISGATSSTYTTPAETTTDNSAKFTAVVTNTAGSATSNAAMLTVTSAAVAPAIMTQPGSQTIIAGKSASFTVAASGTAPLTYQWSKNGAAISGATSATYTTPAETAADNNAQFTVAVSNAAGSATSNAATLSVSASTLLLNSSSSSLSFGNVNVSSNATQSVTLTNAGNSSVTISTVTVSGAGFNASGVSSGLILAPGQRASMTATFAPSGAGSVTGKVSVASNATNSPDAISLSGTGVAAVDHAVAVSWSPSTSTVVGYNAYSSTQSGGPYTKLTSAPVATTSYTDSAVQAGLTYFFVVTSVDANNVESPYSAEVSALVP
jgi:hypothetical protein